MKAEDVRKVGVLGCGLMGSGIVESIARSGVTVLYVEGSPDLVKAGRARIEGSMAKAVERGRLPEADRDSALSSISGTTSLADLADVDLVIEAATEDPATKTELFRRVDEIVRPRVIIASNTSSIPIADLASATGRPENVLGMHFFNPVPVMPLIELVKAIGTSDETLAFARSFAAKLGKNTVESRDRAGFIVNRLLIPYLNGAVRMFEEGFASREDIDAAIHLGLNHPMGPLTLIDFIGVDTVLYIGEVLYEEYRETVYAPPPLLKRMVSAGHLGRKSGRGFYDYGA